MVSRTRIPMSMFPVGGSETDPVSRTVVPSSVTKDGSGEPYKAQMHPDYDCGDEPGHYFISSPLNVYSIGRSGSVVLYVEGGCPNFTWESDNEWATFGTAETSARYNTLESGAGEGQDTTVTVTDANGLEVTISVPWNGAATCCEDVPIELAFDTPWGEIDDSKNWPGEVVIFISGGCPPYTWESDNDRFPLDYAATNSPRNRVHGTYTGYFNITVTDDCGAEITAGRSCEAEYGGQDEEVMCSGDYGHYGTDICHISGGLCAAVVGYCDSATAMLYTFIVDDSTGEIGSLIASKALGGWGYDVKVLCAGIAGGYATIGVIWGGSTEGKIESYKVTVATGAISNLIDSAQIDDDRINRLDFCHVAGDLYAIAYSNYDDDAAYITGAGIDVETGGVATDFELDHLFTEQIHTSKLNAVAICKHVDDETIAVAFADSSGVGRVETWDVSAHISASLLDEDQFADSGCVDADVEAMSHINDGYVVVSNEAKTYLHVYSQDDSNNIALETTHEVEYANAEGPRIIHIQQCCFMLFHNAASSFHFRTYLIDGTSNYAVDLGTYRYTSYAPYGTYNGLCKISNIVLAASCNYQKSGNKFGIYSTTMGSGS